MVGELGIYKFKNKDVPIEPTLKEKILARKAVFPFFNDLLVELKKSFISGVREQLKQVKTEVTVNFDEAKLKPPIVNIEPQVINVEPPIVNIKPPIVKITEKKAIVRPEIRLKELEKAIDKLSQKIVNLTPLDEFTVTNLPVEKYLDGKMLKQEALPVMIKNWEHIASDGAKGAEGVGEKIWLREEYVYTTVSGMQVPATVKKWDSQRKLTLNYEYDANANPVVMSRTIEPITSVGE